MLADNSGTTHFCASRVLVLHIFVLADSSGTSHCGTSRLHFITFNVEISIERVVMVRGSAESQPLTLCYNCNFQYDVSIR